MSVEIQSYFVKYYFTVVKMIAAKFCLVLVVAIVIADSGVLGKSSSKSKSKTANSKTAPKNENQPNAAVARLKEEVRSALEKLSDPAAISNAMTQLQESAKTFVNSADSQRAMASAKSFVEQAFSPEVKNRIMEAVDKARAVMEDPATAQKAAEMVSQSMAQAKGAVDASV